jgi:hypothetical protein
MAAGTEHLDDYGQKARDLRVRPDGSNSEGIQPPLPTPAPSTIMAAETYGRQARICDHTPSSTATIGALIGPTSGVVDIAVSIPGAVTGTPRPARPLHRRGATER